MAAEFEDADQNRQLLEHWIQDEEELPDESEVFKAGINENPTCPRVASPPVHEVSSPERCLIFEVEARETETAVMSAPETPAKCRMQVALDSGAGDHVVGPDDIPNFAIEPSAGSKAGRGFIAANGSKIANLGQSRVRVKDDGTKKSFKSVVQVADVSRPLYSVSKICDSSPGVEVTFNAAEAFVKDKQGRTVAKFRRQGGLYLADLEFTDQGTQPGFTRQGVKA
jgi:hypothetical protein